MSSSSVSSSSSFCYGRYNYILADSYGRVLSPNPQFPFYRTMGQPLVYYAQIQKPDKMSSKGKQRKDNRNCFMKAFHWYTQERECKRIPKKKVPSPNMADFANWLDAKYGEYLRDSKINQTAVEKTSTVETTSYTTWRTESHRKKRFPRMKSPWRRRRNNTKYEERSPLNHPSPSCEFILKPKNGSRPASDHSCRLTTKTYRIESNNEGTKRIVEKSHSLTYICPENTTSNNSDAKISQRLKIKEVEKNTISSDVKREQTFTKPKTQMPCCDKNITNTNGTADRQKIHKEPAKLQKSTCLVRQDTDENLSQIHQEQSILIVKEKMQTNLSKVEVSCQCYDEETVKNVVEKSVKTCLCKGVDVCRQQKYGKKPKASSKTRFGYKKNKQDCHNSKTHNDISCACPRPETPKYIGNIPQVHNDSTTRDMVTARNNICHTILRNDVVQTSDHSITLVNDNRADYALFMKIICADKLHDCVCDNF